MSSKSCRSRKKITRNEESAESKAKNYKEEELTIVDATCPICLSILIEPVSMPCHHALCMPCFKSNVSESNLSCPLCRKRISTWVRKKAKTNDLIDEVLWEKLQSKFKEEINSRLKGKDEANNTFISTLPPRQVSAPGELKEEYETQMKMVLEEQEQKRLDEERASEKVLAKLQEEEKLLKDQRQKLSEGDFEFAKQLRSSQIKETLNKLKTTNIKSPHNPITAQRPDSKSPAGSSDIFSDKGRSLQSPCSSKSRSSKNKKKAKLSGNKPCLNLELFFEKKTQSSPETDSELPPVQYSPSTSTPLSPAPYSSRFLKDITSQYSSESENEFDSEENIIKPPKKRKYCAINKENDLVAQIIKTTKAFIPSITGGSDENELNLIYKAFTDNEIEDDLMKQLLEEQKAAEEKLKQEKEDRLFAMQLQKSFKQVDRSKGSEDEYCLRNKDKPIARAPSSLELQLTNKNETVRMNCGPKYRQTTLLESLIKTQKRM